MTEEAIVAQVQGLQTQVNLLTASNGSVQTELTNLTSSVDRLSTKLETGLPMCQEEKERTGRAFAQIKIVKDAQSKHEKNHRANSGKANLRFGKFEISGLSQITIGMFLVAVILIGMHFATRQQIQDVVTEAVQTITRTDAATNAVAGNP